MNVLYTDGGARGNPGPAGIGGVIYTNSVKVGEFSHYIGEATNNQAEYKAFIKGLELAKGHDIDELECKLDSELIVKQISGEYKVKSVQLRPLFERAKGLMATFNSVQVSHVPRSENKIADALVNQALDALDA